MKFLLISYLDLDIMIYYIIKFIWIEQKRLYLVYIFVLIFVLKKLIFLNKYKYLII